jgi:sugar lactone lactonase YvrE
MRRRLSVGLALVAFLAIVQAGVAPEAPAQAMKALRVVSEQTATGFKFPESVAYDPQGKMLYVSQFGSELKPLEKDGKGKISRVSLDGKVLDEQFLPAAGGVLNKPKGIWIAGDRLWTTDIDAVWVFDLKTRRGKKADLPGAKFANDPTVSGNVLYVSDNRGDQVYRVEPADFLATGEPTVSVAVSGKSLNPNGLYPGRDGLLIVGFLAPDQPRGIAVMSPDGAVKSLATDVGRLDGVYQLDDGTLLVTEWNSGALVHWSAQGTQPLARGFKGPADFCVVPEPGGLLVVVPDLVKSELRMIRLAR